MLLSVANFITMTFIKFSYYSINVCRVCSDIYFFNLDTGNLCFFSFYLQYLEFSSGQSQRSNSTSQGLQLVSSSAPPFIAREGVADSYKISLKGKAILLLHSDDIDKLIKSLTDNDITIVPSDEVYNL